MWGDLGLAAVAGQTFGSAGGVAGGVGWRSLEAVARKVLATAAVEDAFGGWRGPGWRDGGGSWVVVVAGRC